MGKVVGSILKLLFIVLIMPMVHSTIEGPKEIDHWFQKLHHAKPKLTRLHFYLHDIVSGPNQNSVVIAQPPKTFKSTTFFGQVSIFDDPITQGPEPTSKFLGQAQGIYGQASQEDWSLLIAVNFIFTSGKHNGSGLTILGRNAVDHDVREFPIIGGTGVFRLARGFATVKTHFFNYSVAIVEYNVAVIHYVIK